MRWAVTVTLLLALAVVTGCALLSNRESLVLETADAAQAALWRNDRGAVSSLLVPDVADEMTAEDYQLLWQQYTLAWELDETGTEGEVLVSRYEVEDHGGTGPASVRMRYTVAELSGDRAVVRAAASLRIAGSGGPQEFDMEYELVRSGGSWYLARAADLTLGSEFVFYDERMDASEIIEELRVALGGGQASSGSGADSVVLPEGHPSLGVTDLDAAVERIGDHYEAIVRGDYLRAYNLLPASVRETVSSDEFAAQVAEYGITGAEYTESVIDPGTGEMVVTMRVLTSSFGDFVYEWRLAERADGWIPVSRTIASFDDSAPELTPEQLESGGLPPAHPPLGSSD
jgi:hypothetical protein